MIRLGKTAEQHRKTVQCKQIVNDMDTHVSRLSAVCGEHRAKRLQSA